MHLLRTSCLSRCITDRTESIPQPITQHNRSRQLTNYLNSYQHSTAFCPDIKRTFRRTIILLRRGLISSNISTAISLVPSYSTSSRTSIRCSSTTDITNGPTTSVSTACAEHACQHLAAPSIPSQVGTVQYVSSASAATSTTVCNGASTTSAVPAITTNAEVASEPASTALSESDASAATLCE